MDVFLRQVAIAFSVGCAGGVANSIVVWLFGVLGITAALGVSIAPNLSLEWLYPRIVWGGLWGFLFLLSLPRWSGWQRGLIYSLAPSIVQLFVVFPFQAQKGFLGLALGLATPLFVLFFNAVWGLKAAYLWKRIH